MTTNGQFLASIEASLSTRDPCQGVFDVEPPLVPASAPMLEALGTCNCCLTTFYCLICEQLDVMKRGMGARSGRRVGTGGGEQGSRRPGGPARGRGMVGPTSTPGTPHSP